ncbi:hypothetical protein IJ670_07140 [bacterium]|nr:hypothetical protein [bacterium]
MPKKYSISKDKFKKIRSKAHKLYQLIYISFDFAKNNLSEVCEFDSLVTLIEYYYKEADRLLCMIDYIQTKDEECKALF